MNIDKEKVKRGMIKLEDMEIDNDILEVYKVAELYLDGKIGELATVDEIKNIVKNLLTEYNELKSIENYDTGIKQISSDIAETIVSKIGRGK